MYPVPARTRRPETADRLRFTGTSVLHHPLFIAIITAGVLAGAAYWLIASAQGRQATAESAAARREAAIQAITALSDSIYLRYIRAGMLKSALTRGAAPDEVRRRKELYDESLVSHESHTAGRQLVFRDAIDQQAYAVYEKHYINGLKPRINVVDTLLTELTDEYLHNPKQPIMRDSPKAEHLDVVYRQVLDCNWGVTNWLFMALTARPYISGIATIRTIGEAEKDLNERCPVVPR
ncbi:MAG TPA: hypothetical protein VFL57_10895 [Bryobacteraceae bacterium]|nr:hypothetical protein [Bryobacteraceae bacterium]